MNPFHAYRPLSPLWKILPLLAVGCLPATATAAADDPVKPVPFTDVALTSGLLQQRQQTNNRVTLPFALEQCETSGRLRNFDLAAETMRRRAAGESSFQHRPPTQYPFDDTDVYKALEGAAYMLSVKPDPELAAQLEKMIARVAAAQEPDGYLFTFRTMHPDSPGHSWVGQERWTKAPDLSHEFYNLGHLYEAGVAHEAATGSTTLLDICLKNAEMLYAEFGDGEPSIAPGHQVIEMGLAKLYRRTGDKRWLELAKHFLDTRGGRSSYSQDHLPVLEQRHAVGHAVRANYQYSGMVDYAALSGDQLYFEAADAIWRDVVRAKLHLTGGCGARYAGEAYGDAYELPHNCYNETCAAVAFLFWNHRMFLATGDAAYMDVFERTLYNGFLSGVSLSGDRFFYPNTLYYDGKEKNNHGHAGRAPWFGCACCPPNIARAIASLGGYVYATRGSELFVNLYAAGNGKARVADTTVSLNQQTDYPWEGVVIIAVDPEKPADFTLKLRVPGWVGGKPLPSDLYHYINSEPGKWSLKVNGAAVDCKVADGYAAVTRSWNPGDRVELDLPMPVRRVLGNEKIEATTGQVALERGPVVYCLEGVDNDGRVLDCVLPDEATATPRRKPDFLGGGVTLDVSGARRVLRAEGGALETNDAKLLAIPYAWWNNRGNSPMTVWMARSPEAARPTPQPTISSAAKVRVSFCRNGMNTERLNDQEMPRNATDGFAANFDFWPHKGGIEWIEYEFTEPVKVDGALTSWFDDTGVGECRLPKAWRLLHRDESGEWKPVGGNPDYAIRKAEPVTVRFTPVTTKALRLEVAQPDGFSTGLYEFEAIPAK